MPNMELWLADAGPLSALPTQTIRQRAVLAWRRINDKPTTIIFRSVGGFNLSAQVVRLESDDTASQSESDAGRGAVRKLVIFGVRGHPSIPDTVIDEGYRFNLDGDAYRVVDVITTLGEVQAAAEATG